MKQGMSVRLAVKLAEREQELEKLKSENRVINQALASSQKSEAEAHDELKRRRASQAELHKTGAELVARFKREIHEFAQVVETLK